MSDERQAALAKFLKQRRGYLVDIESFNAGWQAAILAERERIMADPGTTLFGRSITEIRRCIYFWDEQHGSCVANAIRRGEGV